jgi:hypothetical protein
MSSRLNTSFSIKAGRWEIERDSELTRYELFDHPAVSLQIKASLQRI